MRKYVVFLRHSNIKKGLVNKMEMKDRIRERRIALGMTQEELADRLGLQKSAIAKYENGRVENIKRSVIQKMASVLQCSPSYLLCMDDEPDQDDRYYLNDDAREYAELLFHHPEYKVLFDAARTVPAKDIDLVRQLIERFSDHDA